LSSRLIVQILSWTQIRLAVLLIAITSLLCAAMLYTKEGLTTVHQKMNGLTSLEIFQFAYETSS
jgi:hypothetical protein